VVDGLTLRGSLQDQIYAGAVGYVADCMLEFITDPNVTTMNENGLVNLLVDVDFIDGQLRDIGRGHLSNAFKELKATISLPLQNKIPDYLNAATRQSTYSNVKPKRLGSVLDKLAKYGQERGKKGDSIAKEIGERRRKESDNVNRIFPGEGR